MELLTPILQAIGLFVATNIDDIIVLSLFYARGAGQRGTTRKILTGQYLGFGGILLAVAGTLPVSPNITTISFVIYLVCRVVGDRRGRVQRTDAAHGAQAVASTRA